MTQQSDFEIVKAYIDTTMQISFEAAQSALEALSRIEADTLPRDSFPNGRSFCLVILKDGHIEALFDNPINYAEGPTPRAAVLSSIAKIGATNA